MLLLAGFPGKTFYAYSETGNCNRNGAAVQKGNENISVHPYLTESARRGEKQVQHITGYQHHRRQSHEPANALSPCRVHVPPQGEGRHLNSAENEDALCSNRIHKNRYVNLKKSFSFKEVLNILVNTLLKIKHD